MPAPPELANTRPPEPPSERMEERQRVTRIVQERLNQASVKDGKEEVARALREILERITNP